MKGKHLSTTARSVPGGFSLIEVTLALAIAAMGFITLLGLLPQGLDMARRSANLASEARIVQKLSGELQSTAWDELNWTGYGPNRYFNDQAMELSQQDLGDPKIAFTLTYVASVYIPQQAMDLALPSGTGGARASAGAAGLPQTYARRMGIAIAPTSNRSFDFASSAASRRTMHSVVVARMAADRAK